MLTAEQEKAVYEVFSSRGVKTSMSAEWEVTQAQHILGTGDQLSPHRQEIFEAILKAVGAEPIAHAPAPRSRVDSRASTASVAAQAEEDLTLLGIAADGRQLTVGLAATADPLAFLTAPGVVLTPAGKAILRRLQEAPTARAAALKLDIDGIKKWSEKNGQAFTVSLQAAIDCEEQKLRDLQIMNGVSGFGGGPAAPAQTRNSSPAPAPAPAPVASTATDQLARDKELAARLGISL